MPRRSFLTALVAVAVAAIAVAATVDAVRGDGSSASADPTTSTSAEPENAGERLTGPDVPPPGALAGMLVYADRDDGCALTTLSLATLRPAPTGLDSDCEVWASPSGRMAVISLPGAERPLALVRFRPETAVLDELGDVYGDPSWSPDGARVAWCGGGQAAINAVVIATPVESKKEQLPGCDPRFTTDGSLLLLSMQGGLWSDSGIVLSEADLRSGVDFDGPMRVLGYDRSPDGTLAVTVRSETSEETVLELWEDGMLAASVPVRGGGGIGELLRFSPDGSVFALGPRPDRTGGPVTFIDLRLRGPTLQVFASGGFGWSPDGAWLAVAEDEEIAIYSRDSDQPLYRLPLSVRGLNWVGGRGS